MKVRPGVTSEKYRNMSFEEVLKDLSARQAAVYNMVLEFGPVTLEDTAELMQVEKNCISGRFTELHDIGLLEVVGETLNKYKTRKIGLYRVKKWEPQFSLQFGKAV
jgi:predicted transcriptional regulator